MPTRQPPPSHRAPVSPCRALRAAAGLLACLGASAALAAAPYRGRSVDSVLDELAANKGAGGNVSFFADPAFDALVDASRRELDANKRTTLYRSADSLAYAQVGAVDRLDLAVGAVLGSIDWQRRYDHMQQHSGQHVLSAAFEHAIGTRTVSFHLGASSATIDLDKEVSYWLSRYGPDRMMLALAGGTLDWDETAKCMDPDLSKIVEKTCREFGVRYFAHESFAGKNGVAKFEADYNAFIDEFSKK